MQLRNTLKKNPASADDFNFIDELLYQAYCLDEDSCDNETMSALRLSKEPLNNTALLSYVLDGHGNKNNDTSKGHAVNVVNKELGTLLKRNMIAAIATHKAQNNNGSSSVSSLTFEPLAKSSSAAAASSIDLSSDVHLTANKL